MVMLNKVGVINMNLETYQLFAQLLEGHINEASTAMNLIAANPGGKEVVQKLHKDMQLAHDLGYKKIDKIAWSDLKGSYRGAWVIIQGTTGTGAIKANSNGTYEAVASTGGETRSVKDGRGGNIIDFLKGEIGKLQKFYTASNTTAVRDKQSKRADSQKGLDKTVTQDTLMKKFKPLWVRAINAAIADIKGHVANQIKNDAFEKAKRKLNYIETLQNGIEQLEAGSQETPGFVQQAVNSAVLMTASHYYPETTGNIERSRYGGGSSAQFSEGPAQLLKDISEGDTKKLGTVLSFFKRSLISG
jgi:hypothetical protein